MAIHFEHFRTVGGQAGNPFAALRRRSSWPVRMAGLTAVLVAAVPLLLIVLAALLAAAVVYAVCTVLVRIGELFGGGDTPTPDEPTVDVERENVRVIGGV